MGALMVLAALVLAAPASAQFVTTKDGPIVYGHHHLASSNIEASSKFFATIGGVPGKFAGNNADIVKFPGVVIFFRAQAPTGGSKGTTADHLGLSVPNLRQTLDRLKAAGYRVVTAAEAPPAYKVENEIAMPNATTKLAFVLGPDDVKVELLEAAQQTDPAKLHHVHFFGQQNQAMRDWYVKVFGAKPRDTPNFLVGDLPGVALNFSAAAAPVAGTSGRAVDHVGFEIKDLEAFCKRLDEMGIKQTVAFRKVPNWGLAIAFITDPWGTSIELTEGLDSIR
jgi:catechol 2,3-dioxygenase-like lactoylglutathione lyase family enzyme